MLNRLLNKIGWGSRTSAETDDFNKKGPVWMRGRTRIFQLDAKGEESWRRPSIKVSWNVGSGPVFCHAYVHADGGDNEVSMSIAVPAASLWVTVDMPATFFKYLGLDYRSRRSYADPTEREIGWSIHDWTLWWRLWMPRDQSSSTDPKWRRGNFNVIDALFGDISFSKEHLTTEEVVVPMPEKSYPAKVEIYRRTWRRERWPLEMGPEQLFCSKVSYEITPSEPIPVPGKGENDWDCGDDAIYSQGGPGHVEQAIAGLVESALRARRKYGGKNWTPPAPAPVVQA